MNVYRFLGRLGTSYTISQVMNVYTVQALREA
jgi:hypothetical protein